MAEAARDSDEWVRKACFGALEDEMIDYGAFRAVVDACGWLGNEADSQAALQAIRSMATDAAKVAGIDNGVLRLFVQAIDDPRVSRRNQQIMLSVLQSYAEIYRHREVGINWAELSTRTIEDEDSASTDSDTPPS